MKPERLQKILARGGIASRRAAEQVIAEGRVRVNGVVVTELGVKADPLKDKVEVDGKRVVAEDAVYILLHKPRGVVATMSDPEGRPTVAQALVDVRSTSGKLVRVFPVGRLDFATSGAILATNDGAFSDALLHPREGVPKTYVVKVSGIMEEKDVEKWRNGIMLEDGVTLPAKVTMLRHEEGKTWFELTIREGRNQQIRRMGEASHFPVMRLARTSFAGITTEKLPPGRWRLLTRDELMALKKDYGVPRKIPGNSPTVVASAARGTRGGRREQREVMPAPRGRDTHGRGPTGKRESAELAEAEMRVGRAAGEGLVRRSGPAAARNKPGEAGRGRPQAPRGGRSNREGRSRAPSAERAGGEASAATEQAPGARYGGGSPGRRGYEVKKDWGGGAERGRTPDRGESAAPPPRGPGARSGGTGRGSSAGRWSDGPRPERDPGAASGPTPRGDVGGGRFGRTRTTGTAGGIGAREDVSRADRPAPRSGDRPQGRSGPSAGGSRGKPSGGGTRGSSNGGNRGRRG
jgi:23S rRNA pseudouridine2605 synthase